MLYDRLHHLRRGATGQILGLASGILAARLIAAGLQAVAFLLLARLAGPTDFGFIATVLAIGAVAQTVADLGLGTYITKARATSGEVLQVRSALRISAMASGALGLLALASLLWTSTIEPTGIFLLPLAVYLALERNCEVWLGVAVADGHMRLVASSVIGRKVVSAGIFVALSFVPLPPLLAFSMGLAAGALVGATHIRLSFSNFNASDEAPKVRVLDVLRESRPFWIHSMASQLRNLDVALVGALASPLQAGFYALPNRVANPLLMMSSAMANVLLPASTRGVVPRRRLVSIAMLVTVLNGAVLVLIGSLVQFYMVPLLGNEYASAILPFQVFLVGIGAATVSAMLTPILQGAGQGGLVAKWTLLSSLTILSGVSAGAILSGAFGAAVGLAAGSCMLVVRLLLALRLLSD